jgi:pyruvate dehydrogenase E2 component (dihydrolipoamide acetyltransferase)
VLAGIETDKATVDFEMQEDGFIAKLLFPEGAKDIPLGTPIAILVDNQKDIEAFTNYAAGGAQPAAAKPTQEVKAQEPA